MCNTHNLPSAQFSPSALLIQRSGQIIHRRRYKLHEVNESTLLTFKFGLAAVRKYSFFSDHCHNKEGI